MFNSITNYIKKFWLKIAFFCKFVGFSMKNEVVFPGQILTVAEEYIAGNNTFEDDDGNIRSLSIGVVHFDENEREVTVETKIKSVRNIEKGDIVFGKVDYITSSVVVVKIFEVENEKAVSFRGRGSKLNSRL